jgi:hypothetical protein
MDIVTGSRVRDPIIETIVTTASLTPRVDLYDEILVTALGSGVTINNPVGSPRHGRKLVIQIKDNGVPRSIGWDTMYRGSLSVALPANTIVSRWMYIGLAYNGIDIKWDMIAIVSDV